MTESRSDDILLGKYMGERRPFIFGVGYILGEPWLENLLHRQFSSDTELAEYMKANGFDMDFRKHKEIFDADTGVVAERVRVNKGGGVGCLELIDEKDKLKLQKLIDEAAETQHRRKLGDREVTGLFG